MAASAQLQSVEQSLRSAGAKFAQFYASLPKETLRRVLLWLLLIWVLLGVVRLIWSFFPAEQSALSTSDAVIGVAASGPSAVAADAVMIDSAAVNQWQLFGGRGGAPVEQEAQPVSDLSDAESNAQETRLQLTLNGIIESDTEKNSRAVITYQGQQDQYAIGDSLPVRGRVLLRRLLNDRVLIENSGKIEALYLFDKRKVAQTAAARPTPQAQRNTAAQRSSLGSSMRQRLLDNPMSITDVVRISEARENGQLIGYKVRPSRDREQFEQLGLQTNDIVLAVNGVALDNVSNAMRVFQTLRTETEASFDISRSGENISLVVSLDDVIDDEDDG